MKRIDTKSLMVFTILFASIISMPMVVNGQLGTSDNTYLMVLEVDLELFLDNI